VWNTQYGAQRLRADDRLTYASGCPTAPTNRFCANGDFQIYDYHSDNEHRSNEVIQTEVQGQSLVGGLEHHMKLSLMRQRQLDRMPYSDTINLLGVTNINGGLNTSSAANHSYLQTNRSDYNTEIAFNDRVRVTEHTQAWLGLRHTQLNRSSQQTDGSAGVQDTRSANTPWVALSQQISSNHMVYASYGQGIEVQTTPNHISYTNSGQPLPVLRSTQREVGIKSQGQRNNWQVTWFDITRPAVSDSGACDNSLNSCTRQLDGQAHHQGLELNAQSTLERWSVGGSAMWLDAKRENATTETSLNGQRPINVPKYVLRGVVEYRSVDVVGLRSGLRVSHEGQRNVTENGDIMLPAWTTLDAHAHYDTKINSVASTWTLAVNNLSNHFYWRESPKQYGQYFLYPGAPRTVRATIQFHL